MAALFFRCSPDRYIGQTAHGSQTCYRRKSMAHRNPTSSERVVGLAYVHRVDFTLSGGSSQPPPLITFSLPLSGPFGFRTSPRTKFSANQSATHSEALPARSRTPSALLPVSCLPTGESTP